MIWSMPLHETASPIYASHDHIPPFPSRCSTKTTSIPLIHYHPKTPEQPRHAFGSLLTQHKKKAQNRVLSHF